MAYGGLDSYGFHALEALQCMVERRRGGETGIAAVQCLEGEAVWRSAAEGAWSRELMDAADAHIEPKEKGVGGAEKCEKPAAFLIEYTDGLGAATLMLNGYLKGWGFAGRRSSGEVEATEFFLAGDPHPHFSYLGLNAQEMFLTGVPQYPVERTLLVSGALDALLDSRFRGHTRVETPHLAELAYSPARTPAIRPSQPRPTGASTEPWR